MFVFGWSFGILWVILWICWNCLVMCGDGILFWLFGMLLYLMSFGRVRWNL